MKFYPQHLAEFLKISKQGYYQADVMIDAKSGNFQVLRLARENEIVFMISDYLELCVDDNINDLNNTLITYYINSRNATKLYPLLQKRVTAFDALQTLELLTSSPVSQLKRVASTLYAALKRFDEGINFSVKNGFFDEAAGVARASEDPKRADQLLRQICKEIDKSKLAEIFAVTASRLSDLAPADTVLELAWRYHIQAFSLPFMISQMAKMSQQIGSLMAKQDKREEEIMAVKVDDFDQFVENQDEGEKWAETEDW